jgi:GNAT superfamily N-acetyltransferase/ketosteroid isomerase-like protein
MKDARIVAQQFLAALAANDAAAFEAVLAPETGLRSWRFDGFNACRPRARVIARLMDEWSAWPDPRLETRGILADGERVGIEFRIQATEHGRYVEHNRSAFLTIAGGTVEMIDLYCAEPVPSAHRAGWAAPATISDDEAIRLMEDFPFVRDLGESLASDVNWTNSLLEFFGGQGNVHPGGNFFGGARWSSAEADTKIGELIARHRARNIGFHAFIGPSDTPADLRERVERQGMILAGEQALMVRKGLDNLDIPINPELVVEPVNVQDDAEIESAMLIVARAFHWPAELIEQRRLSSYERMRRGHESQRELFYLARLQGVPVGTAMLAPAGGVGYLGGAATLPEYRNRRVYTTLLNHRLKVARSRGYQVSAIHAEPMSRRVVAKYGFRALAYYYVYGWMPVVDMNVIKSLVPDE